MKKLISFILVALLPLMASADVSDTNPTESLYGEWWLVGWNAEGTWHEVDTNFVSHRHLSIEIPIEGYVMAYSLVNEIFVGNLTLNGNEMIFTEGGASTAVYADVKENLFFEEHICDIKSYQLEGNQLRLYYTDEEYFVFTNDFDDSEERYYEWKNGPADPYISEVTAMSDAEVEVKIVECPSYVAFYSRTAPPRGSSDICRFSTTDLAGQTFNVGDKVAFRINMFKRLKVEEGREYQLKVEPCEGSEQITNRTGRMHNDRRMGWIIIDDKVNEKQGGIYYYPLRKLAEEYLTEGLSVKFSGGLYPTWMTPWDNEGHSDCYYLSIDVLDTYLEYFPEGTKWTEIRLDTLLYDSWYSKVGDEWVPNFETIEYHVQGEYSGESNPYSNAPYKCVYTNSSEWTDSLTLLISEGEINGLPTGVLVTVYDNEIDRPLVPSSYPFEWEVGTMIRFKDILAANMTALFPPHLFDFGVVEEINEAYFGGVRPLKYSDVNGVRMIQDIGVATWNDGECIFGPLKPYMALSLPHEERHYRSMLVHFERGGEVLYDVWPEKETAASVTFTQNQMATIILPTVPDASKGMYFRLDRWEEGKIAFEQELQPQAHVPYIIIPNEDFCIDLNTLDLAGLRPDTATIEGVYFIGWYINRDLGLRQGYRDLLLDITPDCYNKPDYSIHVGPLRAHFGVSWRYCASWKKLEYVLYSADGTTIITTEEPVTFTKDQMATIILPTAPDASKGKYYRLDRREDGKIIFEQEKQPQARTPYIIVPNEDFSIDYGAFDLEGLSSDTVSIEGISFIGLYSSEELNEPEGFYIDIIDITPDCGFATSGETGKGAFIGALRAYLTVNWDDPYNPGGTKSPGEKMDVVLHDYGTNIASPLGETGVGASIYDLLGRRLSKIPSTGIYIVNGRKMVK